MEYIDLILSELKQPALAWQVLILIIAFGLAWVVSLYVGNAIGARTVQAAGLRKFTVRTVQRLLLPLTMLAVVFGGGLILGNRGIDTRILDIVVPLLISLAVIRFLIYLLRKSVVSTPTVKAWENIIGTIIWVGVALHLLGWLPELFNAMDKLAFKLGNARISLLSISKLVVLIALLVLVALWVSRVIEQRVRSSQHLAVGVQVGVAKLSKFVLLTLAVLVALDAVGIDLTALTVFGGALGVGLGFGLQRIASNFISGFILIMDRSIRPGDVISVGDKFGWVQELRARYVVVMDRDGVETLIPNENLITTDVINWSYTNPNVRLKLPVQISYSDDPEKAMAVMIEAAAVSPRVLSDPPPVCRLLEFGDNGINLELRLWITDPQNGVNNVRSEVNLAIWRGFANAGIRIPFPQRDVHVKQMPAG